MKGKTVESLKEFKDHWYVREENFHLEHEEPEAPGHCMIWWRVSKLVDEYQGKT